MRSVHNPFVIQFTGPMGQASPPPDEWRVAVVKRASTRSFDGSQLVDLIVSLDWQGILHDLGIGLFTGWLYDQFKGGRNSAEAPPIRITITVDKRSTEVEVSRQEDLEEGLRKALDEEDDNPS